MGDPDPRFLAGETAVIVDTAQMALSITVGWDGAADVRCFVAKPEAARILRQIADQLDPPEQAASGSTTLAQKHQEHYRSCGCLGDSAECCEPGCECHTANGSQGGAT